MILYIYLQVTSFRLLLLYKSQVFIYPVFLSWVGYPWEKDRVNKYLGFVQQQ